MTPGNGAVEQGSKVASDVVGGLKAQPMLLAIVVLNVIAIGAAVWFLGKLAENNRHILTYLLEHCIDGKPVPPS